MEVSQSRAYLLHRIANRVVRRRNMMPLQKFLGKALARFQLRRRLGRTKHRPPAPRELIHHPKRKRQLRTHYGEIGLHSRRQRRQ